MNARPFNFHNPRGDTMKRLLLAVLFLSTGCGGGGGSNGVAQDVPCTDPAPGFCVDGQWSCQSTWTCSGQVKSLCDPTVNPHPESVYCGAWTCTPESDTGQWTCTDELVPDCSKLPPPCPAGSQCLEDPRCVLNPDGTSSVSCNDCSNPNGQP